MPQVQTTSQAGVQPYGTQTSDNRLTFRERLMQRFAAHEYVRVKNVDDEPFIWQYLPSHAEEFEYTPDPMKITRRGEPEVWELAAGAEEPIIGENAYLMIEGLYKKLVAKKKIAGEVIKEGHARNFNFASANQQEEWINKIYLGKVAPTFNVTTTDQEEQTDESATKAKPVVASGKSS